MPGTERNAVLLAVALMGTGACSDGIGPSGAQRLTLSVMGTPIVGSAGAVAAPESLTVAGHTMVLEQVGLVLRKIELKRAESSVCPGDDHGDDQGPAASDGSGEGERDDDCEEIAVGPLLVDLPLGAGLERVISVPVDTGTYRGVEFKIHELESTPADQALLTEHPELVGVSVLVTGRYDGRAFTFTTDVTATQESRLDPPLVVADGVDANLTLRVDVGAWFLANGGLVDPADAAPGQPLDQLVRDNIRRSLRLFEDHDRNGKDDD